MAENRAREEAWRGLEARWESLGFDNLSDVERGAIALFWLEGEVMNGGLVQYFTNSSGDLAPLAAGALERLGANRSLELLRRTMERLCPGTYAIDREERHAQMNRLGWDPDPFDVETNELQDLPEDFFGLALDDLISRYAQNA